MRDKLDIIQIMSKNRKKRGFYLLEVIITTLLFSIGVIGVYKIVKVQLQQISIEMAAFNSAIKLNRFMEALEEHIKNRVYNQDTYIECATLGFSEDFCKDDYGNTFRGLITIDNGVGILKNISVVLDICTSDCPTADEFERLKYYNYLSSKLLTISKGKYKVYYLENSRLFTTGNSYAEIKSLSNQTSENVVEYLNTNFNNQTKFIIARGLVKSLGWWLWRVELYYDHNNNNYLIRFHNQGYSSVCPPEYKRPLKINDGQILSGSQARNLSAINITSFPYDYIEGFCLPASKEYVDINKTLPDMASPINMSNYMANTPCRSSHTPNYCCPLTNQPDYCVEVRANINNIPYWIYGFTSQARVNVAHYHLKVGNKYYQVFYMQPHWAYTYYSWWAQNTFGFVVESNQNGISFGFEFLEGPQYIVRPHLVRNIFWINGRYTLW